MLKCKYNEDCSRYPMCGKTCGLSLEELLWHKNQQIRDLRFRMEQAKRNVNEVIRQAYKVQSELKDHGYEPTCPCGCDDCVIDPAYIRWSHVEWWEELGMPTECNCWETDEEGNIYCTHYDDEDK